MLDLKPDVRAYLCRQKSLARDERGREVFVGLTRTESELYHLLSDPARESTVKDAAEYLLLDKKHGFAMRKTLNHSPAIEAANIRELSEAFDVFRFGPAPYRNVDHADSAHSSTDDKAIPSPAAST